MIIMIIIIIIIIIIIPSEQKGCRKGSRGTKDQLLIDKTVLRDCMKKHTNLAMAWIDTLI